MKRLQDRDSPAKLSKRSRSSASQFEGSPRDRLTPERGPRSPSHGSVGKPTSNSSNRHTKSPDRQLHLSRVGREDYPRNYDKEYRILCVSGVHHRVSEGAAREAIFREFKKFEVDVKPVLDNGERLFYLYFRSPEDAREARHIRSKLVLFDKPALLEPVFEAERRGRPPPRRSTSPQELLAVYPTKRASPTHSTSSSSSLQRRSREPLHHYPEGLGSDFLPPAAARRHDERKEKFPNYLHHIPPEEDDKANRTLFVGNLEVNIAEPELRRIFERYGVVEDIDIKRPPPGQGNAYAFIKFLNLDMAHKSKVEMSGQYIGKFQCKIGYGKPIPTTRIWVGGLGPWTSLSHLEREFDRFGAIKKIDFVKGDNHAYILYDSIDAAQAACKEMRGFPLGGPSKRLRVDFADAGPYNYHLQGTAATPRPPPTAYAAEEDSYYRRRIDHEHLGLRAGAADPYYYGSSRDPEYARWTPGSGYSPGYDPYYERSGRARLHDDWAAGGYDRERDPEGYRNWTRDYPSWREGGAPRDWAPGETRRKRPRSPDDLHYEGLPPRAEPPEGPYRRYPRQRSPDGLPDIPMGRRRRSPSLPMRPYRSPDMLRDRDGTPPSRPPASLLRDRRRSRSLEMGADGPERERSSRYLGSSRDDIKTENGRSRDLAAAASSLSAAATTIALPDGHAERLIMEGLHGSRYQSFAAQLCVTAKACPDPCPCQNFIQRRRVLRTAGPA